MKSHEVFTLIEEITRLDGSKYMEVSNMVQNGRAELAVERGLIKQVRILQLNIAHTPHVQAYEDYVNEHYTMPEEDFKTFQEWEKPAEVQDEVQAILHENHIG
ncbi:hypothetical protein [Levilactobacillus tongjiangensis]|uniref:Uncharacterized protein n=1 Tax=Levilactobacillus tongjiangensis TaxID=2486023 RepID=A0ABW1STX8_9LACO|nr:hypothetical protein [Levilactobacillus tongjiangensis]